MITNVQKAILKGIMKSNGVDYKELVLDALGGDEEPSMDELTYKQAAAITAHWNKNCHHLRGYNYLGP
jgi:hypothetical protein